jgi:hypothetical protein
MLLLLDFCLAVKKGHSLQGEHEVYKLGKKLLRRMFGPKRKLRLEDIS